MEDQPHTADTKKKKGIKPHVKPLSTFATFIIVFILCGIFLGDGCTKKTTSDTVTTEDRTESGIIPVIETKNIDFCNDSIVFSIPAKKAILVNLKNCASNDKFTTTQGPSPKCINESTGHIFLTSDPVWEPGLNWKLENRSSSEIKVKLNRVVDHP